MAPAQLVDNGRWLAGKLEQDAAISIGLRIGYGQTMRCQMLHQLQVKRQLLGAQPLEQRQHIVALTGGDEIIGVRVSDSNDNNIITIATKDGLIHRFFEKSFKETVTTYDEVDDFEQLK